jgi:hypothetical protein
MEGSSYERTRATLRRLAPLALAAIALLATGCGDSAEPSGPTVSLHVTRDFGHDVVGAEDAAPLEGHRRAQRLLGEHEDIKTDSGVVRTIDGLTADWEGDAEGENQSTWALLVNGVEADLSAREYPLYPGDLVQFDLRYWYVTLDVRATVGAFPQTFTRGVFGKRFPVSVECSAPSSAACTRVKGALRDAGVPIDGSQPAGGVPSRGQPRRARVLVGPWKHWRKRAWPSRIDAGPRYSGVFARFSPGASELRLHDWYAHPKQALGAGTGLVAAMRPTEEDLLWLVTGVDDEGVERAAEALNPRDLRDAFAVAVTDEGVVRLPLKPR